MKRVVSIGTRFQRVAEIGAVDVADEMQAQMVGDEGGQRAGRHGGAEIRSADPDIDDVGKPRAVRGLDRSASHGLREDAHLVAHGGDGGHHVLAVRHEDLAGRYAAERHMQDGAVLGDVDRVTSEQGGALFFEVCRTRQTKQQVHGLVRDALLGIVENEVIDGHVKGSEPVRIGGKQPRGRFGRTA